MSLPDKTPSRPVQPAFEPLLDSREAARILRMHYKTLERWAREGRLPGHFLHGRWFFRASELDAWVRLAVHSSSQSVRLNSGEKHDI